MADKSFDSKVLELTKKIPNGKVTTYKILAEKLGTKAYRAVGSALKRNKNPVVIPCHRVIRSDLMVGNYSAKGWTKEKIRLLKKEGVKIKGGRLVDVRQVLFFNQKQ